MKRKYPDTQGYPRFLPFGDTAVSIELGNSIDRAINERVQSLYWQLKTKRLPGIVALNPTYRSLLVQYDPWQCSYEKLLLAVEDCLEATDGVANDDAGVIDVPVCYGDDYGPDLEEVAQIHGLSPERVMELHVGPVYYVYMIGFTPGFPYLGGLDERLFTPRKKEPRKKVPAGSVGIADRQTGIYPIESPGGWQIIGRTPTRLFDLAKDDPFYFKPGDRIKFRAIEREEFEGR